MLVKFVNQPKPGKKLGNVKTADARTFFFDPAEFSFTVGSEYEIETKPLPFGDNMLLITKILPKAAAPSPAGPVQQAYSRAPDPSAQLSEPELRFISNVVGQAIVAKTITDPMEVSVWAKAAKQTLKELI